MPKRDPGLQKAIKAAGGIHALARQLGITYSAIMHWQKKGEIPAKHIAAIERLTGVTCEELRPDLYRRQAPS